MARFAWVAALLLGLGSLFHADFVQGAEDVLKLAPDTALGVVVVNNSADLDAKLQSLAREMKLPTMPFLALLKQQVGMQGGIDETGTAALILLPANETSAMPAPILLVPVTDFDQLTKPFELEQLLDEPVSEMTAPGVNLWIRHIDGYAAITDASHREALFKKNLSIGQEISPALTPWREWLTSKDVAAVVLPPGLKRISTELQESVGEIKATFAEPSGAMSNMDAAQRRQLMAVFDLYGRVIAAAENEVTAFGIGLHINSEHAVRLTSRATLASGGVLSRLGSPSHTSTESLLAGLPDKPFVVAAGVKLPEDAWKMLAAMSFKLMKAMPDLYGLTEEQVDQMSQATQNSFEGVECVSFSFGVRQPGQPIFSSPVAVTRVENAQKFMDRYEAQIRQYAKGIKNANSPILQPVEIENVDCSGIPSLQITTHIPQVPGEKENANSAEQMKMLFGPGDTLTAWMMPADEHHVVLGYVDKEHVQQVAAAIKEGRGGLATNTDVIQTARRLRHNVAAVGYVSPAGLIEFIRGLKSTFCVPVAGKDFSVSLPAFPPTPPIGIAVTASAEEIEKTIVAPPELLRAIVAYAASARAAEINGDKDP